VLFSALFERSIDRESLFPPRRVRKDFDYNVALVSPSKCPLSLSRDEHQSRTIIPIQTREDLHSNLLIVSSPNVSSTCLDRSIFFDSSFCPDEYREDFDHNVAFQYINHPNTQKRHPNSKNASHKKQPLICPNPRCRKKRKKSKRQKSTQTSIYCPLKRRRRPSQTHACPLSLSVPLRTEERRGYKKKTPGLDAIYTGVDVCRIVVFLLSPSGEKESKQKCKARVPPSSCSSLCRGCFWPLIVFPCSCYTMPCLADVLVPPLPNGVPSFVPCKRFLVRLLCLSC